MVVKSPSPDVEIPNLSLPEFVLRKGRTLRDKPALIDGLTGRTYTHGQLDDAVQRVATALHARGFRKGDVFAIYSHNIPEYAIAFLAVARVGGIITTANPLYTAGELAKQLKDCSPRFLITTSDTLGKAREAAAGTSVEEIFAFDDAEGATPFADLMRSPAAPPEVAIDPANDLVVLPYSSGTTGLPKGVMLTHRNLVANICQMNGTIGFDAFQEPDRILGVLPLFHIYGMVVVLMLGVSNGATLVTMPRFEFQQFLTVTQQYKLTVLPLVPPIVLGLVKSPAVDQFDLSSVRVVFSGAAPLGEAVAAQLVARLGCNVCQGYGMTEASPVTHLTPTAWPNKHPGSAGLVAPNTEVLIVDPATGQPVGAANKEGELLIRGPQIMKGYLNHPEETAIAIDRDGWYHTGDVGYVDDNGWFYIVDRTKELIKYKGMQVAPAELEALLLTHPAILDVAVVRRPDEEAGEIPKAFIVLKPDPDSQATPAEAIMVWVAERVAPHKRVRRIEFIAQVPKSPSGKILRRLLVDHPAAT